MNTFYETKAMEVAAALVALGYTMWGLNWENKYALFSFENDPEIEKHVELFWKKQLPIDAYTYWQSMKYLKNMLYQHK